MLSNEAIQSYLHTHIPLTKAMGVSVVHVDAQSVRLKAPAQANINHKCSVFGGSLSALATVACWTLVYHYLVNKQINERFDIVIVRNKVEYQQPVLGDFEAVVTPVSDPSWLRFEKTLKKCGRAKLNMAASIIEAGESKVLFNGAFAAIEQ